jgi:hypothetical protein
MEMNLISAVQNATTTDVATPEPTREHHITTFTSKWYETRNEKQIREIFVGTHILERHTL